MSGGTRDVPSRACELCGGDQLRPLYLIDGYHIVTCERCEFVFVADEIPPGHLDAYYDESYYTGGQAQGYDDYAGGVDKRRAHYRALIPPLRRHLAVDRPRVLDVGCAFGDFLRVTTTLGWPSQGVERSAYAAERARSRYGLDVRTGTLETAGLTPGSFDLVTLWDVLEHLERPMQTLRQLHGLIAPNGLLVVATGDIGGVTARIYGQRWALLAPPGHLCYFSRRTLARALNETGFVPREWLSDGAFLVNARRAAPSSVWSLCQRMHDLRLVNAVLRRLGWGSIVTVLARRCVDR